MRNEELIFGAVREAIGDPTNKCYHASEALYHLLGKEGYTPVVAHYFTDGPFPTHWWLRDRNGNVLDVTANQFDFEFPYHTGRGTGFLTKQPSKKAQEIINAVTTSNVL